MLVRRLTRVPLLNIYLDIETSDWRPIQDGALLTRTTSYVKPLTGSIGPKQTTCHIIDEQDHFELDDYISVVTTTRTPDVPSGSVFSVKTRSCLTWAGGNATKIVVTSSVEWTGKSWVKGTSLQQVRADDEASSINQRSKVRGNTTQT